MKLSRRAALIGLVGSAGAAACSKQVPAPAPTSPPATQPVSTPPSTTPTPSVDTRPRWPLSGKLLKSEKDAKHAAVAVKVPDNQGEHPQAGIDQADIVFVELEGYLDGNGYSSTRLVPVFHSSMPESVGPVRSIRPVDIPLLSPIHAIIGNTGAAQWVVAYAKHYGKYLEGMLSYMNTQGTGSYGIDRNRVRSINGVTYYDRAVVCHPKVPAKQTKKFRDGPPLVYFPFADADEASTKDGKKATSVSVPWKAGNSYNMSYSYDKASKTYKRSMPWGPHVTTTGKRVAPANVLVICAKQTMDKVYPGPGHDEPIHEIIDKKGTFYYFYGGRYVKGTWSKGKVSEPFTLTLADGEPLKMAPGQTFVELARHNAKLVIKA